MELEELKELIELLKDTDITELQVEKDGTKVKIKREKVLSPYDVPAHKTAPFHEKITRRTQKKNPSVSLP